MAKTLIFLLLDTQNSVSNSPSPDIILCPKTRVGAETRTVFVPTLLLHLKQLISWETEAMR
jgi:hypothetical protein